jgi:surface protein
MYMSANEAKKTNLTKLILLLFLIQILSVSCQESGNNSIETYSLEITVTPSNGGSVSPSGGSYDSGEQVQITATASETFIFKEWNGDFSGTDNPATITITNNTLINALFEELTFPLTVEILGEGSVSQKILNGKTDYVLGTTVELTAEPEDGWEFSSWSGDLSGSENPIIIVMDEAKIIEASFTEMATFFLDQNGETIKCPDADFGDSGTVNGITYIKRTKSQITPENAATSCTSGITDLENLFADSGFNGNISSWDVSNVTTMRRTFYNSNFNQSIAVWNVGNVTDMSEMFWNSNFNQPIGEWDVGKVTDMSEMFWNSNFNQPIENWNVSSVTSMRGMFYNTNFNHPIGDWDVSSVTDMTEIFRNSNFNQPITGWDVSSVTDMYEMFSNSNFDRPIENWDVGSVTDMMGMFYNTNFNRPIGDWDVSNVENMDEMFWNSNFNQNISDWCVEKIGSEPDKFSTGAPLTNANKPVWGTCP